MCFRPKLPWSRALMTESVGDVCRAVVRWGGRAVHCASHISVASAEFSLKGYFEWHGVG